MTKRNHFSIDKKEHGPTAPDLSVILGLLGRETLTILDRYRADKALLGSSGLTVEKGHSTPNPEDAQIKEAIMRVSDETFVLVDSSKYGYNCLTSFARLPDVDLTITDLSSSKAKSLEAAGATLRIVDIRGGDLNSDAKNATAIKEVLRTRSQKKALTLDRNRKR